MSGKNLNQTSPASSSSSLLFDPFDLSPPSSQPLSSSQTTSPASSTTSTEQKENPFSPQSRSLHRLPELSPEEAIAEELEAYNSSSDPFHPQHEIETCHGFWQDIQKLTDNTKKRELLNTLAGAIEKRLATGHTEDTATELTLKKIQINAKATALYLSPQEKEAGLKTIHQQIAALEDNNLKLSLLETLKGYLNQEYSPLHENATERKEEEHPLTSFQVFVTAVNRDYTTTAITQLSADSKKFDLAERINQWIELYSQANIYKNGAIKRELLAFLGKALKTSEKAHEKATPNLQERIQAISLPYTIHFKFIDWRINRNYKNNPTTRIFAQSIERTLEAKEAKKTTSTATDGDSLEKINLEIQTLAQTLTSILSEEDTRERNFYLTKFKRDLERLLSQPNPTLKNALETFFKYLKNNNLIEHNIEFYSVVQECCSDESFSKKLAIAAGSPKAPEEKKTSEQSIQKITRGFLQRLGEAKEKEKGRTPEAILGPLRLILKQRAKNNNEHQAIADVLSSAYPFYSQEDLDLPCCIPFDTKNSREENIPQFLLRIPSENLKVISRTELLLKWFTGAMRTVGNDTAQKASLIAILNEEDGNDHNLLKSIKRNVPDTDPYKETIIALITEYSLPESKGLPSTTSQNQGLESSFSFSIGIGQELNQQSSTVGRVAETTPPEPRDDTGENKETGFPRVLSNFGLDALRAAGELISPPISSISASTPILRTEPEEAGGGLPRSKSFTGGQTTNPNAEERETWRERKLARKERSQSRADIRAELAERRLSKSYSTSSLSPSPSSNNLGVPLLGGDKSTSSKRSYGTTNHSSDKTAPKESCWSRWWCCCFPSNSKKQPKLEPGLNTSINGANTEPVQTHQSQSR